MPKKAITKRVARLLKSEDVAKQQKGADIYKRRDESIEAKKMKKTKKAINKYIKHTAKTFEEEIKKSPNMMYGKPSSPLKSESPLAKYGCSKKH
jgi:preprotein translocase subunit SecA